MLELLIRYCFFIVTLMIAGCGFHLRKPQPLAPELVNVILLPDATYTPLTREITNQLALAGTTVVDSGAPLVPILTILVDSYSNITLSVGSDGQAREKLLIYTLSFQLTGPAGNVILPPHQIRQNHVVKYDPNFVLAKGYEEDKMIHDMRVDAVRQLVTQLSHVASSQFILPQNLINIPPQDHATPLDLDQNVTSPDKNIPPLIDTDISGD